MTPAISAVTSELQQLVTKWLPALDDDLKQVIAFFKNPPPWMKSIESVSGKLGIGGTALAAAGGLALGRATLSTLLRALFGGGTAALTGLSSGGAAGAAGTGLLPGIALGYVFDKLFPNNWLAQFGSWLGGDIYDMEHPPDGRTPLSARSGRIVRPLPTPNARRASTTGQGDSPLALVGSGGTNIEIGSMTINSRATDLAGIAEDVKGAARRKALVSSADAGQQ